MSHPPLSQHLYSKAPALVTELVLAGRARDEAGIDRITMELHNMYPELVRDPSDASQYYRLSDDCAKRYGGKA